MDSIYIPHSKADEKLKKHGISMVTPPTDQFLDILSTHFLICNEKIRGRGEDCGLEAYNQFAGIIGVFDGCGGLGSRVCPKAQNKTEAFLASRAIGNAVKLWFDYCCDKNQFELELLERIIKINLEEIGKYCNDTTFAVKGSLVKSYPSTMAVILSYIIHGKVLTEHFWAGDSRTYFLDSNGLAQISTDDIIGGDALENLTQDGALTNLISLSGKYIIHNKSLELLHPTLLIAATDGCFGYVSSPMEFEYILLSTLFQSNSVEEWRVSLQDITSSLSGDDQTIAIEAIGFSSFSAMKKHFLNRYKYIEEIERYHEDEIDSRVIQRLWNDYKTGYYRFVD